MPFLFETILGVILGIVALSLTMLIVGISKGYTAEDIIVDVIGFVLWYLTIVFINYFFPNMKIIRDNKLITAMFSIAYIKLIILLIRRIFLK